MRILSLDEAQVFEEVGEFPVHGSGTNVQWVFVMQSEEDAAKFPSVPNHWREILSTVNLER